MNAIEVDSLSKTYRLYPSPKDRLREFVSLRRRKFHDEFHALENVSFDIPKGQTAGIIGLNGSGKSTLLKIICGVLQPTGGSFHAHGRISALLELGAGFNPEFTGRDNVYMNGGLMGFNRDEMDQRFPEIEAFAEIGDFIDQPVKIYSSGMQVRLGFAAAIHIDPEILIVDEALAVGDAFFQHKCVSKMEEFSEAGKTILIVTHDLNFIKGFCNAAYLLKDGQVLDHGDPESVTEQYLMIMRQKQTERASSTFRVNQKVRNNLPNAKAGFGSNAGQILDVRILDAEFRENSAFVAGDKILIQVSVEVEPVIKHPIIGFMLRDELGYNLYGVHSEELGVELDLDENNRSAVIFSISPILAARSYSLAVWVAFRLPEQGATLLDKQSGVGVFQVIANGSPFSGTVNLRAKAYKSLRELEECPDREGQS